MEAKSEERRWFSYSEAMGYTGLGRTLLTQLVTNGEVPAAKIGKRVLISRDGLDRYLESHSYAEVVGR
jgi:excisionase family DNA binding protein